MMQEKWFIWKWINIEKIEIKLSIIILNEKYRAKDFLGLEIKRWLFYVILTLSYNSKEYFEEVSDENDDICD